MSLRHLRAGLYACTLGCAISWATLLATDSSTQTPAKVSPPDVSFQVSADRDVLNPGSSLKVVFSITDRSGTPLENLQIVVLPKDSNIKLSLPTLKTIPAFGSLNEEAEGKINENADFQASRAIFVLKYDWKAGAVSYSSTQNATLSLQVNRQFEEEAKGLPGGTSALLYLILPIITIFLAYGMADSLRKGKLKIPEFKTEYIAAAFMLAILFNFFMIIEWKKDEDILYATPQKFAISVLLLAAAGGIIPSFRWLIGLCYTFRRGDTKGRYLKKVVHQSKTGAVRWTKAKIGGEVWEGALLEQPDGAKVLGACLTVSSNTTGNPSADELKKIVDEQGIIHDEEKLLNYVKSGTVILDFKKKITRSGVQVDDLFVEDRDMSVIDNGATEEWIIRFFN